MSFDIFISYKFLLYFPLKDIRTGQNSHSCLAVYISLLRVRLRSCREGLLKSSARGAVAGSSALLYQVRSC